MKISHVVELTKLSAHTIRYYEKLGLIQKPNKDESGHRDYSHNDIELINWVSCLKKSGMPLSKIKRFVNTSKKQISPENIEILEEHLNKLNSQLDDLHHYIAVTTTKIKNLKSS